MIGHARAAALATQGVHGGEACRIGQHRRHLSSRQSNNDGDQTK
jgi:hypothetical protein